MMELPILHPGDIILTRREGLLPRLIRWATRSRGEAPTVYHHAAIVSKGGAWPLASMMEAQAVTHEIPVTEGLRQWGQFAIYRLRDLRVPEMLHALRVARGRHVGRRYPRWKLPVLLLDQLIGWIVGGSPTIVGRLLRVDSRKKCSPLVAEICMSQGERFGRPLPDAVTPDDIADTVAGDPERWACVVPLTPDLSRRQWARGEMEDEP